MKTIFNPIKLSGLMTFLLAAGVLFCSLRGFGLAHATGTRTPIIADTSVSGYIQQYLSGNRLMLSYPRSVRRFYQAYGADAAWVNQSDTRHTWQAMLLLDCVKLYGLSPADYHPKELLYDPLHTMIEEPGKISNEKKARFDILLTDALITLMNNMHYGKLNPDYSSDKLDDGLALPFDAETALLNARQQEKFMTAIESAQPHSKQYAAMQDKLRQLKGVRQGDCYETPDTEVTKIVINMERVRWAAIDDNFYIQVNIPSFTLKFVRPDTVYQFKVVVGKTTAPTPTLNSNITYLTTFPEWKIPQKIFINELVPKGLRNPDFFENNHFSVYDRANNYISINRSALLRIQKHPGQYYARQSAGCDNALGQLVFRFQNIYSIYLHDTPDQKLFDRENRPFSHSCIRVEKAMQLAELILKYEKDSTGMALVEKAMQQRRTRNIVLKSPVPIKVTYLTCEVNEGTVTNYKDLYNLDNSLEMALCGTSQALTVQ